MAERSACTAVTSTLTAFLVVLGAVAALPAATYYVRPDGGSGSQCSGLADAEYPGSGSAQPCAWDHPFRALPPGGPAVLAGGDTLVIGAGSYMMGYGAPGSDGDPDTCASDYPWDCSMTAIPSGPDAAHPTRILGRGWSTGCSDPPELWGTERAGTVLDLSGSNHVRVECLEITDHAGCAEDHSGGLACERDSYPYGEWAQRGIYAEDSSDVTLRKLDIHGLAAIGVHAGRLADWTVEDVRIAANGLAGWDGDIDGDDSCSGALAFRHWRVEWNGCVETYPGGQPTGCWAQTAGGYGDGVGTGATQGHWVIEDSAFLHSTSDGLDLLYTRSGSTIEILESLLGAASATITQGTLLVASTRPLAISARTYNQTPDGTFGQYLPALSADQAMAGGDEGVLPQLRGNASFRTNLGLVNLGAQPATVQLRLLSPDGSQIGSTRSVTVAAWRWTQSNDIFRSTGAGSHDAAYAVVTTGSDDDAIWAYASVIDSTTGDPTTIPLLVP